MKLFFRATLLHIACATLVSACSSTMPVASAGSRAEDSRTEQIRALEARADRLRDANDIKRLQRAYGFYVDKGMWDDVTDLFTEDATAEYANEGVYVGQRRIRSYLHALGHDHIGLAFGEINNHMILQPVVHVAPDGGTARGRWRTLIQAGQFKASASWGEGIYEVEYRKENGLWKISRLHWYITFLAPYKGGWAHMRRMDSWVSPAAKALPPDRPPTVSYRPWPAAFVPPFHYANPALDSDAMARPAVGADLAVWDRELARMEAHDAIENLQAAYGYYIDKGLWDEAALLFTDNATCEVEQRGLYKGRARIRAALGLKGPPGPQPGVLGIEMQLQPLIHVSEDGRSAKARWRTLEMKGVYGQAGQWGEGVYENEYVIENGAWKISKLHYYLTFRADYDKGWTNGPLPIAGVSKELPPDAPPTEIYGSLPEVYLPPYHYANPVSHAVVRQTPRDVAPELRDLAGKIGLLNDEIDVQNLQRSYGYYVDKHMWDDVADLFADDATLEIGGRGVFVGKARVRQYMYFLGQKGPARGWLYDHSQWQPVVHVADDGTTAKARLRAFIMGGAPKRENTGSNDAVFGEATAFGEATYENRYVKQNGVWKISRLYAYFNMYSPYSAGWAEVGMPNTNPEPALPPDRPPTVKYQTYPTAGLVPYHYKNPVTGR